MPSAEASPSPVPSNHPAASLSPFIPDDYKQQLLKTPPYLLIEDSVYQSKLSTLRNNFHYSYVVQWLYLLRSLIKLTNEAFDVITFEEELLGIASPVFINKLKTNLIQTLTNFKIININSDIGIIEFNEKLVYLLNITTKNEDESDSNNLDFNFNFNSLDLLAQIDIYYQLIQLIHQNQQIQFRKAIDKFNKPHEELKIIPILETNSPEDKTHKVEYFILSDGRLYSKTLQYPKWKLPKTRLEFVEKENSLLSNLTIEPTMISWKCLTAGIYEFDNYIKDLKAQFGKKTSSNEYKLFQLLKTKYDLVINQDLKKRKQLLQRKREIQMQNLMANRKRSSRIEEKERQRLEEEQRRQEELERLKREGTEIRANKRMKLKEDLNESRTERANKRQHKSPSPTTPNQETWQFDCLCGLKGENIDDGKVMVNCEVCNKWQHLDCQPEEIKTKLNDDDNQYVFICSYDRAEKSEDIKEENVVEESKDADAVPAIAEIKDVETITEASIPEITAETASEPTAVIAETTTSIAPVAELISEPAAEPVAEPVTEPVIESVAEPITEPVTEPVSEPAVVSVVESIGSVQQAATVPETVVSVPESN